MRSASDRRRRSREYYQKYFTVARPALNRRTLSYFVVIPIVFISPTYGIWKIGCGSASPSTALLFDFTCEIVAKNDNILHHGDVNSSGHTAGHRVGDTIVFVDIAFLDRLFCARLGALRAVDRQVVG